MPTNKPKRKSANDLAVEEYEKRKLERKKRLDKLKEPDNTKDDPDFTLDKYYDNYMDGPY